MSTDNLIPLVLTISSLSTPTIDLDNMTLVGFEVDATIASTAISLQGSYAAGGTPVPVFIFNNIATPVAVAITHTTTTARQYIFPQSMEGLRRFRLLFGTAGDNAKTVTVYLKRNA
jgi:hypothetical protein